MASQSLFIFGDMNVISTTRRLQQFGPLSSKAHQLLLFDPAAKQQLDDDGMHALQRSTYVVTSIPPIAAKLYDPVLQAQHRAVRQAVASQDCQIRGLGYLSSTGVYGDWQGAWVDESSEPHTATARGVLRLEAEAAWAALATQLEIPLTIFRLGGIYGPMRSVLHNLQTQAKPNSSAARRGQQSYTSRCHVADVVQAVLADMQRRTLLHNTSLQANAQQDLQQQQQGADEGFIWPALQVGSRYVDVINVVDDEPAPRGDVEEYAMQLLGSSQADALTAGHTAAAGSSSSSNVQPYQQNDSSLKQQKSSSGSRRKEVLEEKRVRNDKLKAALGVQLLAPTYREGLASMHAGGIEPFEAVDLLCLFAGSSSQD